MFRFFALALLLALAACAPRSQPPAAKPVAQAPAAEPSGSPAPAPSGTPSPYHYVFTPPAPAPVSPPVAKADDPQILEIDINERTLQSRGPVKARVLVSGAVNGVIARLMGREISITPVAPNVFEREETLPSVPFFFRGKTFDVEFVAFTRDGRSVSVTVPVAIAR